MLTPRSPLQYRSWTDKTPVSRCVQKTMNDAAAVRDEPNTYGFITKKEPSDDDSAFYQPEEYLDVYKKEVSKLRKKISQNPERGYLISKIGAGLANRYHTFEDIIEPNIRNDLAGLENILFLW